MKQIQSFLYKFDLFGSHVNLLQKKRDTYNTFLGSLISIGIITFSTVSFVNMVIDMFKRESPNVVSTLEFSPNPEAFQLNLNTFYISLGIGNYQGIPIINLPDKKYFQIIGQQCIQTAIINNGKQEILNQCEDYEMDICSGQVDQSFRNELQINEKELENVYCFNSIQWKQKPLYLEGVTTSSTNFRYITILVKVCENDTRISLHKFILKECAPQEEIMKTLNSGFIIMMVADRLLDQRKQGDPYCDQKRLIQVTFRHSFTQTVENFFYYLQNSFVNHYLQYVDHFESSSAKNSYTKAFFLANIFLDEKKITYYRTYDNIINILGSIGGLFDALVFMGALFMEPLTKLSQNLNLINSIFAFQTIQGNNSNKNKKIIPQSTVKDFKFQQSMKNILEIVENSKNEKNQKQQSEFKVVKQFLNQKQKKLSINGFNNFLGFFKGYRKKQMQYGLNKIDQKLDIQYIIRKLIEIDKLKLLLLNPDQCKLFDYLPKPTIPLQNKNDNQVLEEDIYFQEEKSFEQKVKEALEAYKISKYRKDSISVKLLQLMDNEIKNVFDQVIDQEIIKSLSLNYQQSKIDLDQDIQILQEVDQILKPQI